MRFYFVISAMLLLSACGGRPASDANDQANKDPQDDDKDKVVINVETAQSYLGNSVATFRSTAILEADKAAEVTTKTSGIILDILVEEGELVEQDQVLLVLESDDQELAVKSAKANYDKSLNNFNRAEQLIEKGLTNREQIDNLKFETRSLKAALDQAKMNLSHTQVKAPFAGTVVKRHVKIGNLIQNATSVFEVVDFNSLQAKIDVPEHHWSIMRAGLDVTFDFDALANQMVTGKIIRVSPVIDSSSGTFQVTVAVDNSAQNLRPGLFAKANIIFDQRDEVVLVDKDAIIREDELSFVYTLLEDNELKKQAVTLGYEMPDSFEIVSGLEAGQTVVTTGKNNLTPDVKVNVVNYDASL
ncbi:efflux RND transporter periplasmic adaptor subunit [Marinicella meishanensis]|uniref:efflux RND transporter periplasmic adaptor subunit n=1 Tax=Marinicella meishanensis TaxID=2873263 RepID=UPI001CBAECEC|nr:efflux RND transporter periplasmic adaptor subunit [Marinicella sp. NBU2979]